jgi:FAD/FMN-containing dehydrogenase
MRQSGASHEILPTHSGISHRFEEMEYALPAEAGVECFREVRKRIREKWRAIVAWRLLYRFVAQDEAWLSPAYGRETVTISLHQNASLPYQEYFDAIEPIFRAYGGRPHWAKKHSLHADELRPLYPEWDRFLKTRRDFDPYAVFLSPYLSELLGVPGEHA